MKKSTPNSMTMIELLILLDYLINMDRGNFSCLPYQIMFIQSLLISELTIMIAIFICKDINLTLRIQRLNENLLCFNSICTNELLIYVLLTRTTMR